MKASLASLDHPIGKHCCFYLTVDDQGIRLDDEGIIAVEQELANIRDGRTLLSAILTLQDFAASLERDDEAQEAVATIQRIARAATPRCEMLLGRLRAANDRASHRLIGAAPLRARYVGADAPAGTLRVAALAIPGGKLR